MTLEDFEKSLAKDKAEAEAESSRHSRSEGRHRSKHHRSSKRESESREREHHHRKHKRRRGSRDEDIPDGDRRADSKGHGSVSALGITHAARDNGDIVTGTSQKRDSWMEAPSALDIDYTQKGSRNPANRSPARPSRQEAALKVHKNEINTHLRDLVDGKDLDSIKDEPAQHEVDYEFGDAGSKWRMTRLDGVFRQAEESGLAVEDIALDRYGDLKTFDDAREEQIELDRRDTYGVGYDMKRKPTGQLFKERTLKEHSSGPTRSRYATGNEGELPQGQVIETSNPSSRSVPLDQTALNRLKAQMMKAKLKGAAEFAALEAEYNAAMNLATDRKEPEVVVLGAMDNRMLAGSARGEVKEIDTKRGRERGLVEDNEDMSIEDMVREERRTRGQAGGDGRRFAERIAKDVKFDNDLDYLEDNASKLAKRVQKSEINLRNTAISDFQKVNKILDKCPLCHHEDTNTPPLAPVVSLGTRVYLTLPTVPEISEGGACIVPIQHRGNLLECDDDEWVEIRNFMKSLTRMYHDQGRSVIFYENAATPQKRKHAAMEVVPLPYDLGGTAPAFFKEAILSADEEWTQHKKIIDTLSRARDKGYGKLAFRRSLAKEMPYFHVWFELDGGLGHVVEDSNRWPKGDLFAREIIGGMMDADPHSIKRQGRWHRSDALRTEPFRKRWKQFDWTRVLTDT